MHYAPCFNCDIDKKTCQRRASISSALAGMSVRSIKFKCEHRKAKFATGQRVEFNWVWFDGSEDYDGLPVSFHGTVLRENGSKFVVQVDHGKDASGEEVEAKHVFTRNDQLLIKVRPADMRPLDEPARVICPTCYLVEGAAEDRCYADGYFQPSTCVAGRISRASVAQTTPAETAAEIPEVWF